MDQSKLTDFDQRYFKPLSISGFRDIKQPTREDTGGLSVITRRVEIISYVA